jgi:hypothetical protein
MSNTKHVKRTVDPSTLPVGLPCIGCGAMMRARLGEPGTRIMFHPAPLCSHLLSKLSSMGFARPDPADGLVFTDEKPS